MAQPDSQREAHWQRVMGGLREPIKPIRTGAVYQFGLLLVALMMVLLPLVYIGLIALAGIGVYWYAIHATAMFQSVGSGSGRVSGRVLLLLLLIYVGPLIAGVILVFFMIKPLFARRVASQRPLSVARRDEPLLFAFVERLCEVVGAPRPTRIDVDTDVNASASFREGLAGFLKGDLVLTIGLPIVAGMTLQQLAGVLAHEFGHFAQGTGMRVTYIIRSINGWFARVVYERDSWDDWLVGLASTSEHWSITLVVGLSRLFVWLTRRVLWLLMIVGHGISSFMLRQMEFDADRYQARVTGSVSFAPMMEKVELLSIASRAAMNQLQTAWREKRLCDDIPTLVREREPDIPNELRVAIADHNRKGKTGWFDSHPSHADRNRSVLKENAAGTFAIDLPATALFVDFVDLSRRATVAFYHQVLGNAVQREHLVPTASMVAERGKEKQSYESLSRYFQGLIHPVRPVFPPANVATLSEDLVAERLMELRSRLLEVAPGARKQSELFEQADGRLAAVAIAKQQRFAGMRVDAKALKFNKADDAELQATKDRAQLQKSASERALSEVLTSAMERLQLALSLEPKPDQQAKKPTEVERDEYDLADEPAAGSGDRLMQALIAIRAVAGNIESLRQHFFVLGGLLSGLRSEGNSEQLVGSIISRSEKTVTELSRLNAELRNTPYPYEHSDKGVSIAKYAVAPAPVATEVGTVHSAADSTLDACYGLYMRILSDLSHRAEAMEAALGLEPLPEVTGSEDEQKA